MSCEAVTIRIPLDLVCPENRRYGPMGYSGRIGTTKRWRASLEAIRFHALHQCREQGHREPWTGPVALYAWVAYPEDARKRADLGAYWKAIGDGLEEVVYEDDAQIVQAAWLVRGWAGNGSVEVVVRRWEGPVRETVWSPGCLDAVSGFCRERTKEHKA